MAMTPPGGKPAVATPPVDSSDLQPEAAAIVAAVENGDGGEQLFLAHQRNKAVAQAALRALNERKNHAAVLALTAAMGASDRGQEFALIERAAALARTESPEAASAFLRVQSGAFAGVYTFQFNAGRALHDADAAHLALPFFEEAMALKRTAQVADRLFLCALRLGRMKDAARMLGVIIDMGGWRASIRRDFASALRRIEPGGLDPATLEAMIKPFAADLLVGPALLPHLIAAGKGDAVMTVASNGAIDPRNWDEGVVLETAGHLDATGHADIALRILCRCGGQSDSFDALFTRLLERYSPAEMKAKILPLLDVPEGRFSTVVNGEPYFDLAQRFMRDGDVDGVVQALMRLTDALDDATAAPFYTRYKDRLAKPFRFLAADARGDSAKLDRLARLVTFWLDPDVKRFFAGPDADRLIADLAAAARWRAAPADGRVTRLRDGYFRFYMERREFERVPTDLNDRELSAAALRYFQSLAKHASAEAIPVGPEFARLRSPGFVLEGNNERAPDGPADPAWDYLTGAVLENGIPSACIGKAIVDAFNVVAAVHEVPGVRATKFAEAACETASLSRRRYDPALAVDSLLAFCELAALLGRNSQYRPFVAAMVPEKDSPEYAFLERALSRLMNDRGVSGIVRADPLTGADLLAALLGKPHDSIAIARAKDAPQDVLLVGHASKSTGLGRNFRMLQTALAANAEHGIRLEELDYESEARDMARQLAKWRRACRTRPIVVYAVNAQDVPLILFKDVRGHLDDVYGVGFFLWEASHAPDVQQLGIGLVDEVWSPTEYVASIYAPHARTHLIGKGLYDGDVAIPARKPHAGSKPFRFVTVFDFDSSIERKNPLAVVLGFQKAFAAGEKVELIVKGSTVNPRHWSNALGQWERLSAAIAGDARITLVTARYSDAEMNALLAGADAFVSLHRGEGFGYVIADAMALGVPVIATDYSGNTDFCTTETSFPVASRVVPVDALAVQWHATGSEWAEPDLDAAAARLREVFVDHARALAVAEWGRHALLAKYSTRAFSDSVLARIKAIGGAL